MSIISNGGIFLVDVLSDVESDWVPEDSERVSPCQLARGWMSVVIRSCDALLHQPSECIRVEIVSLSLKPGSRVAEDSGIVRLFVEYCFLGLPSVETPLSLKKPLPGHCLSYNFSNGEQHIPAVVFILLFFCSLCLWQLLKPHGEILWKLVH